MEALRRLPRWPSRAPGGYSLAMTVLGACPSCGDSRRGPWLRHPALSLWLCGRCGLGYSDPQPRELVEQRYLSEYDLAAHFGALESRKDVLIGRRLEKLRAPRDGARLLDVGCADGQFAAAARRRGWNAHGVELNPPAAQRAQERGVIVHPGRLEDARLPAAGFDLVTAWDVIEHVSEPRPFVRHLVRLVAPGGLIVVTTLNRRALVERVFRSRWSMIVVDHFTYWDADSLRYAFASSGLSVVSSSSFGLGRDFVSWIDRLRPAPTLQADLGAPHPDQDARRSGWDASAAVLVAERALNRALDLTALGVGIELVMRRS